MNIRNLVRRFNPFADLEAHVERKAIVSAIIITSLLIGLVAVTVPAVKAPAVKLPAKPKAVEFYLKKSVFCQNCVVWKNRFYTSIADTSLHRPLIVYHRLSNNALLTRDSLAGTPGTLKRLYFPLRALTGFKDEDVKYKHKKAAFMVPYEDLSWNVTAAKTARVYTFNTSPFKNVRQWKVLESLGRYQARKYDTIEIYDGTYGTRPEPDFLWKEIRFAGNNLYFWIPNKPAKKLSDYHKYQINEKWLMSKLGFDPGKVIPR